MDELLKYMALHRLELSVVANVFVLSATAARYFHSGKIPGVVVTDELLAFSPNRPLLADQAREFFLEFAARQCAIARALGYRDCFGRPSCATGLSKFPISSIPSPRTIGVNSARELHF